MADLKITQLTELAEAPAITDILPFVDDPGGSPATKKVLVANLLGSLVAPQGFLINGKIVPSVASNNLTVAIKGIDGNDPSASNPVFCRIGDTIRSITAALSVTKNAGTNYFNSGGTELATKEIDYFVYLGYNATDGVVVGFSRIPYVCQYDGFSATATAETYCAISTISNAAAGDDYEVIGRFAATLSAGAGYTWTVPTFTTVNLIQRPIYETRYLTYAPTLAVTGGSANTISYVVAKYKISYNTLLINLWTTWTQASAVATIATLTVPFNWVSASLTFSGHQYITGVGWDTPKLTDTNSGTSNVLRMSPRVNWAVGADNAFIANVVTPLLI